MEFEHDLGVFSPDGRLIQVEYAQHASTQGSCMALQAINGAVHVIFENHQANPLLVPQERVHCIDSDRNIYMVFSGLRPDTLLVISEAITLCRNYKYNSSVDISIDMLARRIGQMKQRFTVDPGYRPLGLRSVLLAVDSGVPRIFVIEADGNYSEYERVALGYKSDRVMAYLQEHTEEGSHARGLAAVVQGDARRLGAYVLGAEGLRRLSTEEIEALVQ